jgi:Cu-Zn family superoxide dismutase
MNRIAIAGAGAAVVAAAAIAYVLAAPSSPPSPATSKPEAEAHIYGPDRSIIGRATFMTIPTGVLIHLAAAKLPPGVHAVHIHAAANCKAENGFAAAGPHWNPTSRAHGKFAPDGPHAGDLDNITVAGDGTVSADLFLQGATLQPGPMSMMEGDGTAIVIHAGADDYKTQPAGNSGERIACGIVGWIPINMQPIEKPN